MTWRMRRRSRTICLSLAFIIIFLHLLLALVLLSTHHLPCDPPLPPKIHVLRDLALTNTTSAGVRGLAELPTDTIQKDSSYEDAKKDTKGQVQSLSYKSLSVKEGKNTPATMATTESRYSASQTESLESDLLKLEALFDHPLYNMPKPTIPEDDWLLRVKPKVKTSERSSQMWSV